MVRPTDRAGINRLLGYHFIENTRRSLHFELTGQAQQEEGVSSGFGHVTMTIPETSSLSVIKKFLRGLQRGALELSKDDMLSLIGSPAALTNGALWRFGRNQHLVFRPMWNCSSTSGSNNCRHRQNRLSLSEKNRCPRRATRPHRGERSTEAEEKPSRPASAASKPIGRDTIFSRLGELDWLPVIREKIRPGDQLSPAISCILPVPPAWARTPRPSVVDATLRTHEVENILVASASVFPTAGSANPTCTILQLAMYAARTRSPRDYANRHAYRGHRLCLGPGGLVWPAPMRSCSAACWNVDARSFFFPASFVDPRSSVGEHPRFQFIDVDNRLADRVRA